VTELDRTGFGDRFPTFLKKIGKDTFFLRKGEWEPMRAWVRHPRALWEATTRCFPVFSEDFSQGKNIFFNVLPVIPKGKGDG
jgi:hypothetical protein